MSDEPTDDDPTGDRPTGDGLRHVQSLAEVRARHPVLRVVGPAADKAQVLAAIYRAVDAPAYAAANYDALADVLGDLGWLPPGPVRLGWDVAPALAPPVLEQISRILAEAVRASAGTPRPLTVYLSGVG